MAGGKDKTGGKRAPSRRASFPEAMVAYFEAGTMAAMDAVLEHGEPRTALVRGAVRREVAARRKGAARGGGA